MSAADEARGSSEGSDVEPREALWRRLAAGAANGAAAAGAAISAAASKCTDGLESLKYGAKKGAVKLDKWAAEGAVGRAFRFKERSTRLTTELRAGLITFLMVSYILAVNPQVLATTGGTCDPAEVCSAESYDLLGPQCLQDPDDPGAVSCMTQLARSLITATAASSLISTFFIGYFGNLPLALAPGIGINAYVAYQVVGTFGQGDLTYSQAMTAIFVEGWFFVVLSVTGVRGGLVKYMPKSIALASSVGIGMLLAFTGLRNLGIIVFDPATLLTLGGCPANRRDFLYAFPERLNQTSLAALNVSNLPVPATVFGCTSQDMRSPTMWLGIAGGLLMAILLYMGVKGSLIIGITFVTVISWIPGHAATYLGGSSPIPGGQQRLNVFKQVVAAPTLSATGLAWDWSAFSDGQLWLALFTFLYIDLLDCTGTLLSMARLLDFSMPGFLTEDMEFPGQMWAFLSDGIGIITGSMMGTTPLTVYIESAAGIEDGGRTGVTAITVAFMYFVSLFFAPILASIPPYATGPALVLVGTILLGHIAHIEWDDIGVAIPSFLTMVLMPFTYSVAYGVIAGLVSYVAIHLPFWLADYVRKRWWPSGDVAASPRMQRMRRRSKAGYHVRKTFGPTADPPSRAESYIGGYDDSYHTQDSMRRPGLPVTMLQGGGAAAAGVGAGGALDGQRPGLGHASVASIFFPEGSMRSGKAFGPPRAPSEAADGVGLFRKSYSLHSPGRAMAEMGGGSPGLGHLRSLPVIATRAQRGTAGAEYAGSHAGSYVGGGYAASMAASSPARSMAGGAPPLAHPSPRQPGLGGARQGGLRPQRSMPQGSRGMTRSRTFSHGMNMLPAGEEGDLAQRRSSSIHGGELFKLFPDAPELDTLETRDSFRLFGDVAPLPLDGEQGASPGGAGAPAGGQGAGRRGSGGSTPHAEMATEHSFRLFGDVEPMELSASGDMAAAVVAEAGQPQELAQALEPGGAPRHLRYASFALHGGLTEEDRGVTADLSFGSPHGGCPPTLVRDSMERARHGSTAYSDMLEAQTSEEAELQQQQQHDGQQQPAPTSSPFRPLAAAAAAARGPSGRSPTRVPASSSAELAALETLPEASQAEAAAAVAEGQPGRAHRRQGSGEAAQAEAAAYERLLQTLSGSRRHLSLSSEGEGGASSGSGGAPERGRPYQRSSSFKSLSLAAAAQQLESLKRRSSTGTPSEGGGGGSAGPSRLSSLGATSSLAAASPPAGGSPPQDPAPAPLGASLGSAAMLPPSPFGQPSLPPVVHGGSLEVDFRRRQTANGSGSGASGVVGGGSGATESRALSGVLSDEQQGSHEGA